MSRLELLPPAMRAMHESAWQGFVFLDGGVGIIHDPLPGEDRSFDLLSTGIGVRYSLGRWITARAEYGWQLREGPPGGGDKQRAHMRVTVGW